MNDAEDDVATQASEQPEQQQKMDDTCAEEPARKQGSGLLRYLVFLLVIAGIAGGGWYYQAKWLPPAQQAIDTVLQKLIPKNVEVVEKQEMQPTPETLVVHEADLGKNDPIAENSIESVQPVSPEHNASIDDNAAMDTSVIDSPGIDLPPTSVYQSGYENRTPPPVYAAPAEIIIAGQQEANAATIPDLPGLIPDDITALSAVNIADARRAFWQRDLAQAERLYKILTSGEQVSTDSWGELGNVYYLQAKWLQAAQAYAEAALLLLDKKEFPQAMFLRHIISGLDNRQLQRIDDRLRNLQAPQQG